MTAAGKHKKDKEASPRRNKTVALDDALGAALDPVFKKRGFASRDLLAHWASIAPSPYADNARPDRLSWPRGQAGEDGATLYLSCAPQFSLGLQHEADRIRDAINLYFGYVLVGRVKLSATSFTKGSSKTSQIAPQPDPDARRKVDGLTRGIEDEALRQSLGRLGLDLLARSNKHRSGFGPKNG